MTCDDCGVGCDKCLHNDTCLICEDGNVQNVDDITCGKRENSLVVSNNNILQCNDGYFNNNSKCEKCNIFYHISKKGFHNHQQFQPSSVTS